MRNEESKDFIQIMEKYEAARRQGKTCYLDSDDFIDITEHFSRLNMFREALEAAELGLVVHPDNDDLKVTKVNALICTRSYEKAQRVLDTLDPKSNIDVYFFRGELSIALKQDFDGAENYFRQWIEADEECLDLSNEEDKICLKEDFIHVLASVYELKHWMYSPTSMIHRWVDLYMEKCSPLMGDDKDQELVRICHEEMMFSAEIKLYTAFLDNNPYLDGGWTYLASLYNMVGDVDETLNAAEFALAVNPDDYNAMVLKGACMQSRKNFVEAEKIFRKYIEVTGDPYICVSLAECLVPQGKYDEARESLKMAEKQVATKVKDKSQQQEIRKYISSAYYIAGMYKDALRMTNQVLKYIPLSLEFLLQKGSILLRTGNVDSAVTVFNNAIDVAEGSFDSVMSVALELFGEKQWEYAEIYFKMIIENRLSPKYIHYYVKLAVCCLNTGDYDGFLQNLKLACRLCKDDVKMTWSHELEEGHVDSADYYSFLKKLFVDDRRKIL